MMGPARTNKMKGTLMRSLTISAAVAAALLGASGVPAHETCSKATLHGTYAWAYRNNDPNDSYQWSSSGMESYDGEGHLTWYQLWTDQFGTYTYSGTGTYEFVTLSDTSSGALITASCAAQVSYNGYGNSWTFFVPPDGDAYFYSGNKNYPLDFGKVERISRSLLVK